MKKVKIISLLITIILFISCTTKNTEIPDNSIAYPKGFGQKESKGYITAEDVDEDCEYLKFLLPQAYINYEKEKSEYGFDIDKVVEEIKTQTKSKESKVEKTIDARDFRAAMNQTLKKNLHLYDGHFQISSSFVGTFNIFSPSYLFTTDTYFEKNGDDYYVAKSDLKGVEKGMKFSGNPANLFEWYSSSSQKLYRYCIFSDKKLTSAMISIEDEKYPVQLDPIMPDFDDDFLDDLILKESMNSIYIKVPTFDFYAFDEHDKELTNAYDKLVAELKIMDPAKDVVVDLRNNTGGQVSNAMMLLASILFKNDENAIKQMCDYEWDSLEYEYLDSSLIRNTEKSLEEENPEYEALKADAVLRKKDLNVKPDLAENTVFTGKIHFIINKYTVSASELLLNMAYDFLPKDRIVVIGTPSMGCLETGGIFQYHLPNSGIALSLSSMKTRINENLNYHGETKGIFPDVMADDKEIEEILSK